MNEARNWTNEKNPIFGLDCFERGTFLNKIPSSIKKDNTLRST